MKHIYNIELIIEQIDGYNGGYPDIHLNMKVVAKSIDLAKMEIENYARCKNEILKRKCYVLWYKSITDLGECL